MKHLTTLIVIILLISGIAHGLTSSSPGLAAREPSADRQQGDPDVRTATHDQTGQLSFLGADPSSPIAVQGALGEGLGAEERAMAGLSAYGAEFGLKNPGQELTVMRASNQGGGRASVRYQQVYEGVPIMAGELIVNMDAGGQLLSISGEISPGLSLSTTPVLTANEASAIARAGVAKWYGLDESETEANDPELWIYDERLLRWSERPQELVWRMDVSPAGLSSINELVLVNAETGGISLHFNQIDTALNRTIYDNENNLAFGLPGNGPVRTEGGPTHAVSDVNDAYDFSGDTYDFFMTNHGRDSLDGAGMGLISTVRYCESGEPCPFPNAFWNGSQMVYGDGYPAGDDVVGHELTHGVTDFESGLFYYYQSGAINESFSDVWGEFVDLTNGAGDDSAGVRWLMGEDLPIGAIRNMADPPAVFGDPDKMTSGNYWTSASDQGGVHANSGINNKATFLMVDGGTFNGKTVTGMGITKTAAVYYEVQTALLTSGSDYGDLYNALFQGCLALVGGPAGITNADCQEVRDATDAVEMNLEPSPGFNPEAATCPIGQFPSVLFSDDLESGGDNWLDSSISGPSAWGLIAGYAHSGTTSLYADGSELSSDSVVSMASDETLPAGSNPYLWFAHAYDFEGPNYDGGWFEYSTNSGGSWTDAGGLIDDGKAYDGTLATGNPNAGHAAYLDASHGYVSTRADLSGLAGQNVRFRWRQSTDSSVGDIGWLVDDVMIYTCTTGIPVYLPLILKDFSPGPNPTPTATATSGPSPTPTPIPTNTPTPIPTNTATPTPIGQPWVTIISEDFEGSFPGASWQVFDDEPFFEGDYYWSKRPCRAYAGTYSGWAVGGGLSGGLLACGSDYPNYADSWMIYGPFSLTDATDAELRFKAWLNTEFGFDKVCRFASTNGTNFFGACTWGDSSGWIDQVLDLTNVFTLGDLTGQPNVWVALWFFSDELVEESEGVYVDDILLRKCTTGGCSGSFPDLPDSRNSGIGEFPSQRSLQHPSEE